jgi:hypothetical protein
MWIYYSLIVVLFVLSWNERRINSTSKTFILAIAFLFLFIGFRYAVGCDYFGYKIHFLMQEPSGFAEYIRSVDPFYWLLIDLINYAGLPYEAVNIVTAAIFFAGFAAFALRFPNPIGVLAFSFPLLIFAIPMSATRQAIATGFVLFALANILRQRKWRAVALVILAGQFHGSALIFLGFIPVVFWGGTTKAWLYSSPLLALGLLILSRSELFSIASSRYIEGENDAAGAVYRTFVLFAFGAFFQLVLRRKWAAEMPESSSMVNAASIIMILLFPASFLVPTISDRLGYYLGVLMAVIAAHVPRLRVQNADMAFLLMITFLIVFFVVWSNLSWQVQLCYSPYNTWVFGYPDLGERSFMDVSSP